MTFEAKNKIYELSHYLAYAIMPYYPKDFLLNPKTFSILNNDVFSILFGSSTGSFHFPIAPVEISSWISENSDTILSGKCLIKGWKVKDCYFLAPVLIKRSCEMQLANIALTLNQKVA